MRVSRDEFDRLVRLAMRDIPQPFATFLEEVIVEVENVPPRDVLDDMGIDDPRELLGLYQGTPLTERGVESPVTFPDRITLYQRNIEDMCESDEEIVEEVRRTVLHEVGHHFGLDEDELDELGYG